jgi:molybdopterin-containing oxidoreductase family iron-sulfur binding subunit
MRVAEVKLSPEERFDGIDLEASDYDQQLGRKMGEDARRVANGELSQAEFYDRYHDAVLAEFGEDQRDTGREGGADE